MEKFSKNKNAPKATSWVLSLKFYQIIIFHILFYHSFPLLIQISNCRFSYLKLMMALTIAY